MNTSCSRDFCVFFGRIYKNHSAELAAQQGGFDSEGSHFCNLIDLYLFFLGKSGVFQRLDMIQNLRRFGRAIRTLVTIPSRRTQLSAISASVCPRLTASSLRAWIWCRRFSVRSSACRNRPSVLIRLSSGIPCRYRSVSIPCASGLNAMMPFCSRAALSFGRFAQSSGQRWNSGFG